jgi:hypothetical protein
MTVLDIENSMYEYRFRAECLYDAIIFLNSLFDANKVNILNIKIEKDDYNFPDCEVEIKSNLNMEQILSIMRLIRDSHVMIQTLNIKSKYTGVRNFDQE